MLNVLLFMSSYSSGFVLALVNSSVWAFVLYQIVYFMNPSGRWWGHMIPGLSYSFFSVILMVLVFIKEYEYRKTNRLMSAPQLKWVYFILSAYLLTMLFPALPDANKYGVTNFFKMVVILSIAYKLIDENRKLDFVLAAFLAGAAYIGFQAHEVGRNSSGRVEGIGTVDSPDANGTAAAIVPALVVAWYFFARSASKWGKLLAAFAGALVLNGIVLINSRASFLAALISLGYFAYFLVFSKYQTSKQKYASIILIVFGIFAASFVVDESALDRFSSIKEEREVSPDKETGWSRVYFWVAAVDMATDYPLGTGVKGFEFHAPDYIPEEIDTGGHRNRSVHSSWFEALTETGWFGLFCVLMLVRSVFWATKKCKETLTKQKRIDDYFKVVAIEGAFLAYLIAMSFMNRYRAEVFYWLVLFSACAYNIFVVKESTDNQKV